MDNFKCANCQKQKPSEEFNGLTRVVCSNHTCCENTKTKPELRILFNSLNKHIKQCSKCLHKKERAKFNKMKDEENVGLCEECADKVPKKVSGKESANVSVNKENKDRLEANYQTADDNIVLEEYEVICMNCNKWTNLKNIAVDTFNKQLCNNCKDICINKKDSVRKAHAITFNQKYNDVHMCSVCYWIKSIEKFKGAKGIANRCDSCRGVVAVTQSNANKITKCVVCKLNKPLLEFIKGSAGRCNDCQHEFDCNRHRNNNRKREEKTKEFNLNNDKSRQCDRCRHKLKLTEFNGENKRCKKCSDQNKKYEANRDKEHKKQVDKERYQRLMNESLAYDVEGWTKCKKCGFEGDTKKHFLTEDGVEIWYCIDKCHHNRQTSEKNRKDTRHKGAEATAKLYNIVKEANKNKQLWDVDEESVKELLYEDCFYCGYPPTENQLNSIDRINHDLGFISGNVVTSCETCNRMKGTGKLSHFIKKTRHMISQKNPERYNWDYLKYFPDTISGKYSKYKYEAGRRYKTFNLSLDQFTSIVDKPCHYCGKQNSTTHCNGVDRKISSKELGYQFDNCVSSCTTCNMMKHACSYDEFLDKIEKVATNPKLQLKK